MPTKKDHEGENGNSHTLQLIIDGVKYSWPHQYITGKEIRTLAGIADDKIIYLVIKKPWEDELITDDVRVDLARPSIEHFVSKPKDHRVHILVNGRKKEWEKATISFWEVVKLAFPEVIENGRTAYTVTYDKGPKENSKGTMTKGDVVYVKNEMVFNVTATDKS
ncbi:MAG: multiubiquitin domain-containing protein [Chitinophagales bacterium]|nr:multiubiquitin domain-containing protein [Chitinophagales bacterium]